MTAPKFINMGEEHPIYINCDRILAIQDEPNEITIVFQEGDTHTIIKHPKNKEIIRRLEKYLQVRFTPNSRGIRI